MGQLIEASRPKRCAQRLTPAPPRPPRPSAPPCRSSTPPPPWTPTAWARAWTRWIRRSQWLERRRSERFLSVACQWIPNLESSIFSFGRMRVTRDPCWRWPQRTGRQRAQLDLSRSTREQAQMRPSRTCSKEFGSIPTCPRPSGWSLQNLTRRSANPSRWSLHQLCHSLHLCTPSPDKRWVPRSSTQGRICGHTLWASTRSSCSSFNSRPYSTMPAYSISCLSGPSSDCRTPTRPEQGGQTTVSRKVKKKEKHHPLKSAVASSNQIWHLWHCCGYICHMWCALTHVHVLYVTYVKKRNMWYGTALKHVCWKYHSHGCNIVDRKNIIVVKSASPLGWTLNITKLDLKDSDNHENISAVT